MKRILATASAAVALAAVPRESTAQSFARQIGVHDTSIEVEVHGAFNGLWWGGFATGPGFRVGIPLARNVGRLVNNMPAINFGADVVFFPWWGRLNGWYWYISSPVVLQWNIYVHHRWSLAPEVGFAAEFYPAWYGYCGNWGWAWGANGCGGFALWPSAAFVARYHFRDNAGFPALVMRLGFPVGFNIGVSF
jgi:hypothetical protein